MQWIQGCENNREESQYVGGGGGGAGAGKGAKFAVVYLLERSDGLGVRVFVSYCCWAIDFRGMYAELGLNRILRLSRFINPCHRYCYYSVSSSSSSSSSDLTSLSAIVLPFPGCLCFGTSAPPRRNLVVLRCRIDTAFAMMVNTSSLPPNDNNSSSSSGSGNGTSVMSSRQPFSGGGMSDDGRVAFGYASFQGKRATMEDFFDAKISKVDDQDVGLFGVFDGHGGSRAAEYLKKHLFQNLLSHPQFTTDTKLALTETYQQTDSEFLKAESSIYRDDGSTASTAVLVGDRLYVANVGDSRAVILKAGEAIQLSEDHKPNRVDERQRIEQAGGNVMWAGTWRVGGVLAVSRAFGNRLLKRFVVAEPEIQEEIIKDDVEFLVIASDGLWDVVSNEDAVELVKSIEDPEAAAIKLTETAYMKGSADNITCVVVRFNHNKIDFA